MIPREILKKIHQIEIRTNRLVNETLGGAYHSVFKGQGMNFEEVREYQPGDDIRAIDWNVTARTGHPFVKRFVEERELTVMLVVDVSASQQFGTRLQQKREVAAELAAVLAFSAITNNDRVGLIAFTDRVERLVPPRKGARHVLRLIRDVLFFQAEHRGTQIREALRILNRVLHRRAIVFLISDFCDRDYEHAMRHTGRRHDLIAVPIRDPREEELPAAGLMQMEDAESGKTLLLDTSRRRVRERFAALARKQRGDLRQLAKSAGIDLVEVSTDGGHLDALVRFFDLRQRRLRKK
jgi:uncharacterized protein (DUF58 family)